MKFYSLNVANTQIKHVHNEEQAWIQPRGAQLRFDRVIRTLGDPKSDLCGQREAHDREGKKEKAHGPAYGRGK